jgi:plastocyanin
MITVKAGSTVTWYNQDYVAHTVSATGGGFDSGRLLDSASFSHTFTEPTTFEFQCNIHPAMKGRVIVE